MEDLILDLAETVAGIGDDLRIAFQEASSGDAPHHLELDRNQLGRNFATYAHMAKSDGESNIAIELLKDWVLPLKDKARWNYNAGLDRLKQDDFTSKFPEESQAEWLEILEDCKKRPDQTPPVLQIPPRT